jgi:hypothetical protein
MMTPTAEAVPRRGGARRSARAPGRSRTPPPDHSLRFADSHPARVVVHSPDDDGVSYKCTGVMVCEGCGLLVVQYSRDPRATAPHSAVGFDLDALAAVVTKRDVPACEPLPLSPRSDP